MTTPMTWPGTAPHYLREEPKMNSEKEREAFEAHFRSLPPYNESHEFMLERKRDGTYKFSNVQEYFIKWQARAALSTEAQPEVTGAVAEIVEVQVDHDDYSLEVKLLQSLPHGTKLYPPSAIEAAVREKLEEIQRICEVEKAGYDEPPRGWDRTDPTHAEYFGYQQACDDIAERIRALMKSPHTSVEEPAN